MSAEPQSSPDTPLNRRSRHLVVLVATYNRLELLKQTLDSIAAGTSCDHEVMVIDGGSKDGTIEFITTHPAVTPVLQGALVGTARAYNRVWRHVESRYTCWLSDDTTVTPGTLDAAVGMLEGDRRIGMVGLKMKDTAGPWTGEPYVGGISEFGILNCNHGVLRTDLLAAVGYFNEGYRSYHIDPDLTASVLCTGRRVVMTKRIGVLHRREWAEAGLEAKMKADMAGIDNARIYRQKFGFLAAAAGPAAKVRARAGRLLGRVLFPAGRPAEATRLGLNRRDWNNLTEARFIRPTDPLDNRGRPYHLVQQIPDGLLLAPGNPYRHLAAEMRKL